MSLARLVHVNSFAVNICWLMCLWSKQMIDWLKTDIPRHNRRVNCAPHRRRWAMNDDGWTDGWQGGLYASRQPRSPWWMDGWMDGWIDAGLLSLNPSVTNWRIDLMQQLYTHLISLQSAARCFYPTQRTLRT